MLSLGTLIHQKWYSIDFLTPTVIKKLYYWKCFFGNICGFSEQLNFQNSYERLLHKTDDKKSVYFGLQFSTKWKQFRDLWYFVPTFVWFLENGKRKVSWSSGANLIKISFIQKNSNQKILQDLSSLHSSVSVVHNCFKDINIKGA